MRAKIIIINGTSSAGKSTIARALQPRLSEPFCYYASDQLADAGFRPKLDSASAWEHRTRFFDGFHRSIPAFAEAGNNLIVEHIVEEQSWANDLAELLAPFDVFWVGVHAPLSELERRERERGNRTIGEARFHLKTHSYCKYDVEVDSTCSIEDTMARLLEAWERRSH